MLFLVVITFKETAQFKFQQYPHFPDLLVLTIPYVHPGDSPEHDRITASKKFGFFVKLFKSNYIKQFLVLQNLIIKT